MNIFPILSLTVSLTIPITSLAAQSPLHRALGASTNGPSYAYDIDYSSSQITASGRMDPGRPVGKRVTVTSPARAKWTKDFRKSLKEMEKKGDSEFWCSHLKKDIPRDARLVSQTATTATYRFTPLTKADDDSFNGMQKHLVGTVMVAKDRPAILHYHVSAAKSFKPSVFARINKFDLDARCARAPDGRTYVERFRFQITGSALGKKFSENIVQRHSALRRTAR